MCVCVCKKALCKKTRLGYLLAFLWELDLMIYDVKVILINRNKTADANTVYDFWAIVLMCGWKGGIFIYD